MRFRFQIPRQWRERFHRFREGAGYWILFPIIAVGSAILWVGRWFSAAWGTRNLRNMLQGAPAVIAAVGVLTLGVVAYAQDKARLTHDYEERMAFAWRQEDYPLAKSLVEKQIALEGSGGKQKSRYHLAFVLQKLGQGDQSLAIMRELAKDSGNYYGPAHTYMGDVANIAYRNDPGAARKRLGHYLKAYSWAKAEKDKFAQEQAARRLASVYLQANEADEAEKYIKEFADSDPVAKLQLAVLYLRRGKEKEEEAKVLLKAVVQMSKIKVENNPEDHSSRKLWADALVGQHEYAEAIKVLKHGMDVSQGKDPSYFVLVANVAAVWEAEESRKPNGGDMKLRFGLIQDGLAQHPANLMLLRKLVDLSNMKGEEAQKSKELIQKLLLQAPAAPVLHFILGSRAYNENKISEARFHWEQAYAGNENFTFAGNNLAWLLAHDKNPDLQRALEIIESVIAHQPLPPFLGTRGEIYRLKGDYDQAFKDLKVAVQASPNNADLHEAIAECYEKKKGGDADMAANHHKRAAELRAQGVRATLPTNEQPKEPDAIKPPDGPPDGPPSESPKTDEPKKPG